MQPNLVSDRGLEPSEDMCTRFARGGGVPGVPPGHVVIIGGGVVGFNAALMAVGLGARVTILDRDPNVLESLDNHFRGRVTTVHSNTAALELAVADADVVVGAVLVFGAAAPKLVTRAMLRTMRPGSVVVDVAIDQGGCFETSRATTHADPTFVEENIVHYCVANMPGAVARTSTYALNNVTMYHALKIANLGANDALLNDQHLLNGLNVHMGMITCKPVADALGYDYVSGQKALNS